MAPPQNRRPGFSRKAQYGLFAGYVVAVSGALLGLLLVITSWVDPAGHNAIRALLTDLTAPVSRSTNSLVWSIGNGGNAISEYFHAASKNAALREELAIARRKLIQARAVEQENDRLKRLLGAVEQGPSPVAVAPIVSSSATSSRRYAILNAGSRDNVRSGQAVRGPDGLIGRVVETGGSASRVLLVSDTGMIVPVIRVSDGLPGIATGTGDGAVEIRALSAGSNIFRAGDVFVTSGTGGVYPPRIPVAIAIRARGDIATARPLSDPGRADHAVVLPVYQPVLANAPAKTEATAEE